MLAGILMGAVVAVVVQGRSGVERPEAAVEAYLSDLKARRCGDALGRLTRSAAEQVEMIYASPKDFCERLSETQRIPVAYRILGSNGGSSGGQFEVTAMVSYPDAELEETFHVV